MLDVSSCLPELEDSVLIDRLLSSFPLVIIPSSAVFELSCFYYSSIKLLNPTDDLAKPCLNT